VLLSVIHLLPLALRLLQRAAYQHQLSASPPVQPPPRTQPIFSTAAPRARYGAGARHCQHIAHTFNTEMRYKTEAEDQQSPHCKVSIQQDKTFFQFQ
jgi:hypothetical protein